MTFTVNGKRWHLQYVQPWNINLMRDDGSYALGMTDDWQKTVYISTGLDRRKSDHVLCHELCHVFAFSYNIRMDAAMEEIMADFIATHGRNIINIADDLQGILEKYA